MEFEAFEHLVEGIGECIQDFSFCWKAFVTILGIAVALFLFMMLFAHLGDQARKAQRMPFETIDRQSENRKMMTVILKLVVIGVVSFLLLYIAGSLI